MKLLVIISVVCLAYLVQVTVSQDDSATVEADNSTSTDTAATNSTSTDTAADNSSDNSSDNSTSADTAADNSSDNSTSADTAADTSSSNSTSTENTADTSSANSTSTDDTASTSSSNSTTSDSYDDDSSNVGAPSNMTAPAENTPGSNATTNGTTDATSDESSATEGPVTSHNISDIDMTLFGLSGECADEVTPCYIANSADSWESYNYCQAYTDASACISEVVQNSTSGNETGVCTAVELTTLKVFSCAPSGMGLAVAPQCFARLTRCAVSQVTPQDLSGTVDNELFEKKVCESLHKTTCLQQNQDGAVCSASEISAVDEELDCSGTSGLVSSALLLALMFVVTRVM